MKSDRTQRGPTGFILLEPGNIMQILPEDNKSWLTLFYSLPEKPVSKRLAYMNLPRCPFDVIRSDDYAELFEHGCISGTGLGLLCVECLATL